MKAAAPALVALLAALRTQRDAPLLVADCFTLTLRGGTAITVTNADVPITLGTTVFAADGLLVDGLRYMSTLGLDVDTQQITIIARERDTIGGVPFLQAIRNGVLDGCTVQRDRAFLTSWAAPPVGSVTLFKGRVATVDSVGRTTAAVTVASDLALLDVDMPRNLYGPTCNHVLFDSGCSLIKNAWSAAGVTGAGATATSVPWNGATPAFAQGTLRFTGGANTGATATIKAVSGVVLTLAYPLPTVPAAGDPFTATQGCDHTLATCRSRFNNGGNFRGFPFVPVPETALA